MQVLFLALGGSRKRAVVEESADVVAAGGRAVVLVDRKKSWASVAFAPGVEVVTPDELEARHLPRRIERFVLFRIPRLVASVLGVGPVRRMSRRALKAYERRVAGRVHRRVFLPVHRRVWPTVADRIARRHFGGGGGPELLVVTDPWSVQHAVRLMEAWESDRLATPCVTYSVDSVECHRPGQTPAQKQTSAVR
ncbi:hypothetical protein GCM10020367_22420 [Streptomyces sannanensis]|uniref:Uncharacterized protein n=1 Tax=Streptomyces sannanensis TaxID=285536 RepID=A0ABP6S9R9_9ACTN